MKRAVVILAVAGVLVAAGWFVVPSLWFRDVVVATVTRGTAVSAVPGSVYVIPEVELEVRSEARGKVIETSLAIGAEVVAGAELVKLDPADVNLAIDKIAADLAAARKRREIGSPLETELKNAQDDLAKAEVRQRQGGLSEADLERSRRQVQQLEQRLALARNEVELEVQTLENALAARRRELEKTVVRAPMDGTVTAVEAVPGSLLEPGQPVARLVSRRQLVEARISEESFAALRPGQKATVRFRGYGDRLFAATVARVLPTADPVTQRYSVYLDVPMEAGLLTPGLTGEATIAVAEREGALIAPRRALVGSQVRRVAGGRVEVVPVRTGFTGLTEVEVLEGVAEGDRLVVEEPETYREGERVRLASGAGRASGG